MTFFKRYPKLAKSLMLLVLIAIFPFDGVFLLIADAAGIEAAFALFVVMLQPVINWFSPRLCYFTLTLQAIKRAFKLHELNRPTVFISHAVLCSGIFVLTSSLIFAGCIWLPALVAGNQWL